jgi:Protein of unknown function (DUF3987)
MNDKVKGSALNAVAFIGSHAACMSFRTTEPRSKVMAGKYKVGDHECQVEILDTGNQFVVFDMHPDTGREYEWSNGSPLGTPFVDLPALDPETINTFLADAGAVVAANGVPVKEKKQDKRRPSGGDTFWTRVNSAALADPERWVPELFPSARREASTGAWRVTSEDLGRPLEEDISIHADGIRDFGREKQETPINLVVEYAGAATTKDAALWLCERLGVDPADLGWENRQPWGARFGEAQATYEAANDHKPDCGTAEDASTNDVEHETAEAETVETLQPPTALPPILQTQSQLADFTRPGGLVENLIDWISSSSSTPSRELALGAVLAFLAALIGRRYSTGQRDTRANTYIVALAPSGFGKDHARQQLKRLGEAAGESMERFFGPERVMSASGLRSALERWPSIICFMDEFGGFMRDILDKRAGDHKRAISVDLRDYFSASNTNFAGAEYAQTQAVKIYNPNLNIYGTATPGQFWSALSNASAEDGLLPRMLLFNVGDQWPDTVDPTSDVRTVPQELVERLLPLARPPLRERRSLGTVLADADKETGRKPMDPIIVEWTDEAAKRLRALTEDARLAARNASDLAAPFISRLAEHTIKLALILAVSHSGKGKRNRMKPLVDLPKFEWAAGLARLCVGEMVASVVRYVSDNEREELFKLVAAVIQKGGKAGVSPGVVIDKLPKRFGRLMREEVLSDMVEAGHVKRVEHKPPKGRTSVRLFWKG